jgi:hypothetical protein
MAIFHTSNARAFTYLSLSPPLGRRGSEEGWGRARIAA